MSQPPDVDRAVAERLLATRLRARSAPAARRDDTTADEPHDHRELSAAQERMWFVHALDPSSAAYNITSAARLEGDLRLDALRGALAQIVERHDTLRSTFPVRDDGLPYRVVDDALEVPLATVEAAGGTAAERTRAMERIVSEQAVRPFDLAAGPLARFTLVRLSERDQVLAITLDHIVSDGWSLGVLYRELREAYAALRAGREPQLPELASTFTDVIRRERRFVESEAGRRESAYWRAQLDELAQVELPMARPRPPVARFAGRRHDVRLPETLAARLDALARENGTSLYVVLATAFVALLHRYSGQEDVVVGTPVANRDAPSDEDMIGLFVNSFVLRADLSGHPTFAEALRRVRQTTLEALEHRRLPFEQVVGELAPERTLSHNPLFQVMFALQDAVADDLELDGLTATQIRTDTDTARLDLECTLWRLRDGLRVRLTYNVDIFEDDVAGRIVEHYRAMLMAVAARPETAPREVALLSEAEVAALDACSAAPAPRGVPACLHALFEAAADAHPGFVALETGDGAVTFDALECRANQLAHELRARGAGTGEVVGVCAGRTADLVVALLGVLKAGAAFLPLNLEHPLDRRAFLLEDACVRVLLTDSEEVRREHAGGGGLEPLVIASAGADRSGERPGLTADPADLAYVIYTSGTTGRPKGVAVEHRNVVNTLQSCQDLFGFGPDDVGLVLASSTFDVFLYELFSAMLAGGRSRLVTREDLFDPAVITELLAGATSVQAVPGLMEHLLHALGHQGVASLPKMRHVVTGGDLVPSGMLDTLKEVFPEAHVAVTYGPTEAAIFCTSHTVERDAPTTGHPIGRPLAGAEVRIVDDAGAPLPRGMTGELWIGGRGVARGYVNRDDETASRFVTHDGRRYYRSGDRGRWRGNGVIEFRGRSDSQVKVRGVRIELGEVDAVLAQVPGVRHAVTVPRGDTLASRRLAAFVVPAATALDELADAAEMEDRAVGQWRDLFDATHVRSSTGAGRDFTGWNSSYDGSPLPVAQMDEWLDGTLTQLRARLASHSDGGRPPSVLEIGCGTGLVLLELAEQCGRYVGTDFSHRVLDLLRAEVDRRGLANVELHQAEADRVSPVGRSFDAVVINSVAQYFPNEAYLRRVLEAALRAVGPDGFVFVGDVRNAALLETFAASLELDRPPAELGRRELLDRARARARDEDELVVAPGWFRRLAEESALIGCVELEPRRGSTPNELTKYRYDVMLWRRAAPEPHEIVWRPWGPAGWTLPALVEALDGERSSRLGLVGIPNALLEADLRAARELEKAAGEHPPAPAGPGVLPDELRDWAAERGWTVALSLARGGGDGTFDAYLERSAAEGGRRRLACDWPAPEPVGDHGANDPLRRVAERRFAAAAQRFLADRLPDYMLPSSVTVLDALPLSPNGKVDRDALPAGVPESEAIRRAAESPSERLVANVWSEVLGAGTPAATDDFFASGGTSLLAIQLTVGLRARGVPFTPQHLFELRTVERIAAKIDAEGRAAWRIEVTAQDAAPAGGVASAAVTQEAPAATSAAWEADGRLLLTGATGMLGVHVLDELLQTQPRLEITCLVRERDGEAAPARLLEQYRWYFPDSDLSAEAFRARVSVVTGDLRRDRLGLDVRGWDALADGCDQILHVGADVRHVAHSDDVFAANYEGTRRLLELAAARGAKRFLHVSTIGVAGRVDRSAGDVVLTERDLDVGQHPSESYSASKIAAERAVREHLAGGYDGMVFRVGTVAPHSATGRFQRNIDSHFFSRYLRSMLELGVAGDLRERRFSLVPVDVMARMLVGLASRSPDEGTTFHIQTPHVLANYDVVRVLQAIGYAIRLVPGELFADVVLGFGAQPALADAVGRLLPWLEQPAGKPVRLDFSWTVERLAELQLTYAPPTTAWFARLIQHGVDVGYLPPPPAPSAAVAEVLARDGAETAPDAGLAVVRAS